ncbi:MAG: BRO-N domain-containing protein [Janthinobacterium lividum]
MPNPHTPTLFTRHNRPLHTLWLESQAWFHARDLGRLMGRFLDEHAVSKLDPDQTRTLSLLQYGEYHDALMISESGAYTLLVHHNAPENPSLRHWLTHEVIAVIRDAELPASESAPSLSVMQWPGLRLSLLHWQNESWMRMRDLPEMLESGEIDRAKLSGRWRWVGGGLRLGCLFVRRGSG